MKTFEFEGKSYKEAPERKGCRTCDGCAFDFKCDGIFSAHHITAKVAFGGSCGERRVIYTLAEDNPTPADIARRIGEEAATYAEQAIANKIADALEDM